MSSFFHASSEWRVLAMQSGIIVLVTLCCNFALLRLFDVLGRVADKSHSPWRTALLRSARLPASLLAWLFGLLMLAMALRAVLPNQVFAHLREIRGIALIVIAAAFAIRLVRNMERQLLKPQDGSPSVDLTTARAISKLLRLAAFVIAMLMGLQTLGVSVSGVLAFGGVGAMAVGFAAKDMLANFFGGLMVYLDRPFRVGDHIKLAERDIDGQVEDIGWRVTCIRNSEKRPLYIPNSVFTSAVVENYTRMSHRHISFTVGLRYDDASKMAAICDDVRQMLRNHPDIDGSQRVLASFDVYNTSSLDFLVHCYTKATHWADFHGVKQDIMLKIMDIVAAHGAEFAFPTQTLFVGGQATGSAAAAPDPARAGRARTHSAS